MKKERKEKPFPIVRRKVRIHSLPPYDWEGLSFSLLFHILPFFSFIFPLLALSNRSAEGFGHTQYSNLTRPSAPCSPRCLTGDSELSAVVGRNGVLGVS
jgi:hypothetical protein